MYVNLYNFTLTVILVIEVCEARVNQSCPNLKTPLGHVRKRRHLAFPEGSAAVLTSQLVTAFMTHIPSGWNIAIELDVLFPLPDANYTVKHTLRKKLHHRQKREVWQRLENALNFHNLNGRACMLKSICEAKVFLAPPGKSLVHDILRAIFTAPEMDEEFQEEIQGSYDEVLTPQFCEDLVYCPISLLNFIFSLKVKSKS